MKHFKNTRQRLSFEVMFRIYISQFKIVYKIVTMIYTYSV